MERHGSSNSPSTIQAKLSQRYINAQQNRGHSPVLIGNHTLDVVTGLGIIDETNIAAQIRRAVDEYLNRRTQDPTLPDQIAASEARRLYTVQTVAAAIEQEGMGHLSLPAIEVLLLDYRVQHVAACAICQTEMQSVQESWIESNED